MHSSVKHCQVLAHQHFIHEGRDSINWGRLIILKSSYQWKEKIWGSFHVLHQRPASHRDVRRLQEVRWSTQQLLRMNISPITFPIQRNLAIVRASTTYLLIFFIGNWHYCFPPTHSFSREEYVSYKNQNLTWAETVHLRDTNIVFAWLGLTTWVGTTSIIIIIFSRY